MATFFGYEIVKKKEKSDEKVISFTPKPQDDGAIEIAPFGVAGTYLDLEGTAKSESALITKYRQMAHQPEADTAIDDIVSEAVVYEEEEESVQLVLDGIDLPETLKNKIRENFDEILNLLNFKERGYEIFRNWYIDGRLYYHKMIDVNHPELGIQELRYIDPRKIKKVRETPLPKATPANGVETFKAEPKEFYIYNPKGVTGDNNKGIRITKDSITYVNSGVMDDKGKVVLSYLHKAIKPLNQLRMLEDATVIYRIARAPERRIFYIDVGTLPKMKAEQYLRDMMIKHKNRLVYDASTGEVKDDRKFMSMLEDFWLPRREGQRGTEITTLPAGQNLGEMEDVNYFLRKLYKALNVPVSRLEPDSQFNLGRPSEITRDELKFARFVSRLRRRFAMLFDDLMATHLSLKGVLSIEDWEKIRYNIYYNFLKDNYFAELKDGEIMQGRLALLTEVDPFVGKYFSKLWVQKNILRMDEEEIEAEEEQIETEQQNSEAEGGFFGPGPVAQGGTPIDPTVSAQAQAVQASGGPPPDQGAAPGPSGGGASKPKPKSKLKEDITSEGEALLNEFLVKKVQETFDPEDEVDRLINLAITKGMSDE